MNDQRYIAEAAQATEVLLQAIAHSDGTRAPVIRELRRVQVEDGILGSFRFDTNGDVTPASFTIFRITGAKNRDPEGPDYFAGAEVDRVCEYLRRSSLPEPPRRRRLSTRPSVAAAWQPDLTRGVEPPHAGSTLPERVSR